MNIWIFGQTIWIINNLCKFQFFTFTKYPSKMNINTYRPSPTPCGSCPQWWWRHGPSWSGCCSGCSSQVVTCWRCSWRWRSSLYGVCGESDVTTIYPSLLPPAPHRLGLGRRPVLRFPENSWNALGLDQWIPAKLLMKCVLRPIETRHIFSERAHSNPSLPYPHNPTTWLSICIRDVRGWYWHTASGGEVNAQGQGGTLFVNTPHCPPPAWGDLYAVTSREWGWIGAGVRGNWLLHPSAPPPYNPLR